MIEASNYRRRSALAATDRHGQRVNRGRLGCFRIDLHKFPFGIQDNSAAVSDIDPWRAGGIANDNRDIMGGERLLDPVG